MRAVSFLLSAFALPVRAVCYYPNGDVSAQDVPCSDGDTASVCCGPGMICLSNRLCKATGNELQSPAVNSAYVRGTCTDKMWKSGGCPNFCINPRVDELGRGMPVERCEGDKEWYYCVNENEPDCDTRENILVFEGQFN